MTRTIETLALFTSLLAASAAAQVQPDDWRMPCRVPIQNIEPPDYFDDLRQMRLLQRTAPADKLQYDENGVEQCDHVKWQQALQRLLNSPFNQGMLSSLIRNSASTEDRSTAFYGAFYLEDPAAVMGLIEHIPGEPSRNIREEAYERALKFMRVHLGQKNPGDLQAWREMKVGPAGRKPPMPGTYRYGLALAPFVALLTVDEAIDRAQGMWFLNELTELRPDFGPHILAIGRRPLKKALTSKFKSLRDQARRFVADLDPEERPAPDDDASDEDVHSWFEAVFKTVYPPVRRVSDGLIRLYPSPELDRIAAAARRELDGLFTVTDGKTDDGAYYRGLRLERCPEPLDRLDLEVGSVIVAINGTPVASAGELKKLVEAHLVGRGVVFVEFVSGGKRRAKEYRVVQ